MPMPLYDPLLILLIQSKSKCLASNLGLGFRLRFGGFGDLGLWHVGIRIYSFWLEASPKRKRRKP